MQRVYLALLLSILLCSCMSEVQPTKATSVPSSLPSTQTIFHLDSSALAYGIFETNAASISIEIYNSALEDADISIEDESGVTTYKVQPGESTIVHPLPPGKKQVCITSGGQSKLGSEIRGIFINKITFDGPTVQIEQNNNRVVVYGDSLAVGGKVDYPSTQAWPVLLRKHYSVIVEAYGFRALYDDASTPAN